LLYYSFNPDNVIPLMKKSCANKNNMINGIILTTVPAIKTGQFVEYIPCIEANPNGSVILSIVLIKTKGPIKSFHTNIKTKTPNVASAGLHSGKNIRQ